jgi:hypothetical protein
MAGLAGDHPVKNTRAGSSFTRQRLALAHGTQTIRVFVEHVGIDTARILTSADRPAEATAEFAYNPPRQWTPAYLNAERLPA